MANLARGRQLVSSATPIQLDRTETFSGSRGWLIWEVNGLAMTINIVKRSLDAVGPVSNGDTVVHVPSGGVLIIDGLTQIQFASSYDICVGTAEEYSRVQNPGFFDLR